MQDSIDYPALIDAAMRGVVRDTLKGVKRYGLPGDHHFFISYRTDFPGIGMSEALRTRYPKEITIVIQHQFWDLVVEENYFSVALSFNNIPEKLTVPFAALTAFADPSVKFGLQFNVDADDAEDQDNEMPARPALPMQPARKSAKAKSSLPVAAAKDNETDSAKDDGPVQAAEVISLDSFRKK